MPIYGFGNVVPCFGFQHTAASVGGTTNETALYSKVIPANTLGVNGSIRLSAVVTTTNSANNKIIRFKFGTATFTAVTVTSTASISLQRVISNRNSASSQIYFASTPAASYGANTASNATGSVDTTQDQTLSITGQTTLEAGFAATSCTRAANVVTVVKTGHGLNSGEYVQVAGSTPASFDADPIAVTWVDANTFTYANTGNNESTSSQPTIKRYSVIQAEDICVEVMR